ncbi:MAG: hypothetical protein LQ351_005801 [Letrouitia transgressa]|nr:MAG: hypothetical protein LQ351_005801 [Letrouitia transgressa]
MDSTPNPSNQKKTQVVNVSYKRQAHAAQSRSRFDSKQSIWHDTANKILVGRFGSGTNSKTRSTEAVNSSTADPPHDVPSSASSPHSPAGNPSGALNGTGLAILGPDDPRQIIRLFYQHHTGRIRSLSLQDDVWQEENSIVRMNVKREHRLQQQPVIPTEHVLKTLVFADCVLLKFLLVPPFYVASFNILQEAISVGNGTTWQTGRLGDGDFRVANHSKTALTACNLEISSPEDGKEPAVAASLKLWYGAEDESVQELSWAIGDTELRTTFIFSNLHAGSSLASSYEGVGYAYLWTTTDDNDSLALWKDFGGSNNNGQWGEKLDTRNPPRLLPQSLPLRLATSLATSPRGRGRSRILFQSPSDSIESVFVSAPRPQLRNTTSSQQEQEAVAAPHTALPETDIAVAVTDLFSMIHGPRVHVFFQDEGGRVVEYAIDREEQSGARAGCIRRDVPIGSD